MTAFVNDRDGKFVAMINKQDKLAAGFRKHEPWLLLYNTGRTERFARHNEAVAEAKKSWPGCTFSRT